jgi:hypothetical protein
MKTFLISKTTTTAEVYEVKANNESEAELKLRYEGEKHFKKVSHNITDMFYQSEGEAC